jgi:hypothetical protein
MYPRTKEDFDTLFRELEAWRLRETQLIKKSGKVYHHHHLIFISHTNLVFVRAMQ